MTTLYSSRKNVEVISQEDLIDFVVKHRDHLNKDDVSAILILNDYFLIVEDQTNKIVAFVAFSRTEFDIDCFQLFCLCVDEEFRNQGYAKKLIIEVEKTCYNDQIDLFKEYGSLILASPDHLISFYEKAGFSSGFKREGKGGYILIKSIFE